MTARDHAPWTYFRDAESWTAAQHRAVAAAMGYEVASTLKVLRRYPGAISESTPDHLAWFAKRAGHHGNLALAQEEVAHVSA